MNDSSHTQTLQHKIKSLEKKIVEQRHWMEMLRDKDSQLKAMVEAFDGLIYVCSSNYRVEYINERYIKRIGYDATGQTCYKALHQRDDVCPWCLNQRIFKGETVRCEVLSHRNKWYHVVSTPIFHVDGSISKHAMIIDVSDRKQAEMSLKKKVEDQQLLLDNTQTQIWYLTDVQTYGAVNQAHARFWGLGQKEMAGKTLPAVLGREKAASLVDHNREVFTQKTKRHTEQVLTDGRGRQRLLSIIETPKLDAEGNVEYVVCSGQDITDIRESEERLRESKKRLDLAMEATSDALWDWDLKTNRTYFNPTYYTMLGYEPYELPASLETWRALIHPADMKQTFKRVREYVRQKTGQFESEYRMKTKAGGWRWIMARGKVVQRDVTGTPVRMVGTHVDITARKANEEALRVSEATLREENLRLKTSLKGSGQFGDLIGKSPAMLEVYEIILKAAQSGANVIIYGESGTGKELVAKTIHDLSSRNNKGFVTVNCGAVPENLIESEFFGYRKGAFTGAQMDKPGYLDVADGGSLFLDEVGDIDLNMQVKLLRVLEGGGYTPLGSHTIKHPDIRIIAATNKDLKESVEKNLVREDFYYRIHIIPILLPPLRDRRQDISLLIHHFLQQYSRDKAIPSIPEKVMRSLQEYEWPGNVRELQNTIHRYVTLRQIDFMGISQPRSDAESLIPEDLMVPQTHPLKLRRILESFEKKYIEQTLQAHSWQRTKVAALLGINRRTLFRKIRDYGLN